MLTLIALSCCVALSGPRGGPDSPAPQPLETVAAIQVHGNTATPDDEVRKLAGIEIGVRVEADTVEKTIERLKAAKRFEHVDVLKRFASIADPSQILLVIVVDEGPVKIVATHDASQPFRVTRTHRWLNLMVMPVLSREDGYGFAYGARFARPGVAGKDSRLSFPLTWGGDKRAGAEIETSIPRGPIDRLSGGVAISRRTNPFFERDDDRTTVWVRGERQLVPGVRVGATGGWQRLSFLGSTDRFASGGADVLVDTRIDPVLPRNAVYAKAGWEHLAIGPGVNRVELDARGYLGLFRQNVIAVRALRRDADRPLPPALQPLLGGMSNLRGFAAGTAVGDTLVATSAELIVPLSSPISVARLGVSAFVDAGTAYAKGARFRDQTLKQGYGGSVWFSAAFLRMNIAVAHGRDSSTRLQLGANITF